MALDRAFFYLRLVLDHLECLLLSLWLADCRDHRNFHCNNGREERDAMLLADNAFSDEDLFQFGY